MAGSDGVGPLFKLCDAICNSDLDVGIAVVTGKNVRTKNKLESANWTKPVYIYGFSNQIHDFMQAADIFVSKAGPTNIVEAFNSGLPIILYSRIPGQEDGNVSYVVNEGAGVWAPTANEVVETISRWIEQPQLLESIGQTSFGLAKPESGATIVNLIHELL